MTPKQTMLSFWCIICLVSCDKDDVIKHYLGVMELGTTEIELIQYQTDRLALHGKLGSDGSEFTLQGAGNFDGAFVMQGNRFM
ncbi:hypothetical protein [Bacteroides sp.]|uniref:hypothetical protein n=1 Tax=Bacteroides sp. TaxID=29523 RepID=UPI00257F4EE7|nr:hypothetical protein [Bacteroides sp.]MBE6280349.1 hypothetical protein [Bacteroides sp.]